MHPGRYAGVSHSMGPESLHGKPKAADCTIRCMAMAPLLLPVYMRAAEENGMMKLHNSCSTRPECGKVRESSPQRPPKSLLQDQSTLHAALGLTTCTPIVQNWGVGLD